MKSNLLLSAAMSSVVVASALPGEPLKRSQPISGRIVGRKAGETAVLQPSPTLRDAEVRQELKPGDVLRTNKLGTLALDFVDHTQIRLGRNTVLVVKEVRAGVPSQLQLQRGSLWGRAPRGRANLSIETPSANAGIRGTSWSLNSDDDRTTLQVFDGEVELANDKGSLSIASGQAALARKGFAPARIAVVNPDERQQMLYYVPFTDAVRYLRPYPAMFTAQLGVFAAASKVPAAERSAEDWLAIAEAGAEIASPAIRSEALARANAMPLTEEQHARALLVGGLIAAQGNDWAAALEHLNAALPRLDERRREVAQAALRLAAVASGTGADEHEAGEPSTAAGLLGAAYLAAYEGDLDRALEIVRKGEALYPSNADFADLQGSIGLLRGDRKLLVDAMRRGTAAEPDHPGILLLSAHVSSEYFGDYGTALKNARRATELIPGNSLAWNILGTVQTRAGFRHAAALSFARGIEADPADATVRANYAVLLLDWNDVGEAGQQLDFALQSDPQETVTHAFRGRALLQQGRYHAALDELLAASTASPTDSQALLLLAYTYYRLGDTAAAMQQLDLASRYDPNSPYPDALRSLLLGDERDSAGAIRAARAAVERNEALAGSRLPGTAAAFPDQILANQIREVGLDDWSRFLNERSFDPFEATAYFERAAGKRPAPYLVDKGVLERVDEDDMGVFSGPAGAFSVADSAFHALADEDPPSPPPPVPQPPPPPPPVPGGGLGNLVVSGAPDSAAASMAISPFDAQTGSTDHVLSDTLQGLATDPLGVAVPEGELDIFRQQFVEAAGSLSAIAANGAVKPAMSGSIRGIVNDPAPVGFSVDGLFIRKRGALPGKDDQSAYAFNGWLGAQLSPRVNVVASLTKSNAKTIYNFDRQEAFTDLLTDTEVSTERDRRLRTDETSGMVMLEFQVSDRTRVIGAGAIKRSSLSLGARDHVDTLILAEDSEFGDVFEQTSRRDAKSKTAFATAAVITEIGAISIDAGGETVARTDRDSASTFNSLCMCTDALAQSGKQSEARAFAHVRARPAAKLTVEGGFAIGERADYSLGGRYMATNRQAVSAAFTSTVRTSAPFTLEPTTVAGLFADAAPSAIGSRTTAFVARWESQWSDRLFTALEAQHQNHEQLLVPALGAFLSFVHSDLERPAYLFAGDGSMTRVTFTTNVLLTDNVALDAVAARASSKREYYLPKNYGKAELTWSSRNGLRASLASTYVGSRRDEYFEAAAGEDGPRLLDSAWWLDGSLEWRAPHRRFEAGLHVYNIFGRTIDVYNRYPRFGRTAVATVSARF